MSWDSMIVPIALLLLLSWLPGILAANKGRSFLKYFFICLGCGILLIGFQPKLAELLTAYVGERLAGAGPGEPVRGAFLRFLKTVKDKDSISTLLPTVSLLLAPVVTTIVVLLKKNVFVRGRTAEESAALPGKRLKGVSYSKWGFMLIYPFFMTYLIFTLTPQIMTVYNSFFENYRNGLKQVGPNFVGLKNYIALFTPDKTGTIGMLKYFGNTMILWVMGAVPQIVVALLLAVFFTSYRLKIKGQQFFKTVIYMPNLIMAAAFSMLFFTIFSTVGPINQILLAKGIVQESVNFLGIKISVRILISLMNFLMWFGNTTILLMAGIQGIDQNMFEAAEIDGASSLQVFFRVTLPLLMPILVYTVITAMIGGLQMFDVPQVLTNGKGTPDRASMTMIMYLNNYLGTSKNFGMAGAISVVLFIISAGLSFFVYGTLSKQYKK